MGWFDSLKRERKEAQAVTEVKEPIIESVPAVDNKEEAVEEEYQVIEREPAPQIEDQSRTVPVKTYAEKKAVTHVVGADEGYRDYQSKRWRWKINDGY